MTKTALVPAASRSLYSGTILALLALALLLEGGFVAALARGGAPAACRPLTELASAPASPCACP